MPQQDTDDITPYTAEFSCGIINVKEVMDVDHLRLIMDSRKLDGVINLPDSLRDQQVVVIILPVRLEIADAHNSTDDRSAFGSLHRYANPSLIHLEDHAWSMEVAGKHAKS